MMLLWKRRLFSPPFAIADNPRPQADWPRLHAELRRPGVTLFLLWEEYLLISAES